MNILLNKRSIIMSTDKFLLEEYKTLLKKWRDLDSIKENLWFKTMKNDKEYLNMETKVWYLEWKYKYLNKLIHTMPSLDAIKKQLKYDDNDKWRETSNES